ncbi:MAG: septum site-determining protein MinD [Caldisericia bacterium]|jgi:septum site-determining protein MinD|nr:septum site-determining protein MinD [Caldisericia bacterium]MDD3427369.1 septum site-determining protein MinD [Caldisericia bacterium]MDD5688870.1 septum site-determining protein MinD [Caldisericia bacterium]HOJ15707.1 septum site-determining protein MinD [Caldisericia bacterium]HOW02578.1 septum site-determining protein MinD [Caldisericia bacterium]
MNESIVVTSGKGGVGKTTIVANVGVALAQLGHSVALVDADIGLRNLDIVMGLESKSKRNLVDVLRGLCSLDEALTEDKRVKGKLFLLAASQAHKKEDIDKESFQKLINELKKRYDYTIIDCPAGIEYGFSISVKNADRAIIVVNPDVSSVRDADRVIGIIENDKVRKIELIINKINLDLLKKKEIISIQDIIEILGVKLIGVIPDNYKIIIASNVGKPIPFSKDKDLSSVFINIAKRLTGEKIPVTTLNSENDSKSENLWNKVKKTFERK